MGEGSCEDAGAEAFSNDVVDGGSSAVCESDNCASSRAGLVVEANGGAGASS